MKNLTLPISGDWIYLVCVTELTLISKLF